MMRSLTVLVAVVALAVTSLASGMARGQATPVGMIEICQGLTAVSVSVDADGVPVTHVHLCPDAVLSLVADLSGPVGVAVPVAIWVALDAVDAARVLAGRDAPLGVARGPPVV